MNVTTVSLLAAVSLLSVSGENWNTQTGNNYNSINTVQLCHCFVEAAAEMLNIPGGRMSMGTDAADGRDGESPTKEVQLQPFQIDKYPVTNTNFRWENCEMISTELNIKTLKYPTSFKQRICESSKVQN